MVKHKDHDGEEWEHAAALAGSRRFRRALLVALRWAWPAVVFPLLARAGCWVADYTAEPGRAPRGARERAQAVERAVGMPPPGVEEPSLRDRTRSLEQAVELRAQEELRARHDTFRSLVAIAAAVSEHSVARRPAAVRSAVSQYEALCQCLGDPGDRHRPYGCARDPEAAARDVTGGALP